jgi:four helix bundle protein
MDRDEMKQRTKRFAIDVIRLTGSLPRGRTTEVLGKQLLRAGTSVGANYRAACRAKSPADFISKMGTVEEEGDETTYWMELLLETGFVTREAVAPLMREANELLSITIAAIRTARAHLRNPQSATRNPQSAIRRPPSRALRATPWRR